MLLDRQRMAMAQRLREVLQGLQSEGAITGPDQIIAAARQGVPSAQLEQLVADLAAGKVLPKDAA